jgi:hypothetical protein
MRLSICCLCTLLGAFILPGHAALRSIGYERQMFFDQSIQGIIESSKNTKLRLNYAQKLEDNPVIKRDRPWEASDIRLSWVIYDESLGKFRMRYSTRGFRTDGRNEKGELIVIGEGKTPEEKPVVCEAFSEDGIHWVKPELGLVEYNGSTANNILPDDACYWYILEDLHDPDQTRHYKAYVREGSYDGDGMRYYAYHSADAYKWVKTQEAPIIDTGTQHGRWGPAEVAGGDPSRKTDAAHMENNFHMHSPTHHRRSIGRAESTDGIHWSEPETIIAVDDRDYPDTEFYHFPTTTYEGWYIGFLWIFSTTNTTHEPEFVFSRDGINYDRTYREPIIRRGDHGRFDSNSIYANNPIIHNGEVLCYYTGTNWRSPEQLVLLGDKATAGIGLARLPLDGFVSYEGARHEFSEITTKSFDFTGQQLHLNMQAALQQWGAEPCEVQVEILDGRHAPYEGFTFEDADTLTTTGINQVVTWNGKSDVSALEGKNVRLKIRFKNAKLYGFQFQ